MDNFRILVLIIGAWAVSSIFTYIEIPIIQSLKGGQNIRKDGPESHLEKAGTPTMGGIAIILSVTLIILVAGSINREVKLLMFAMIAFGAIGFLDDAIKIFRKENLGLRAWQKMGLQIAAAVLIAWYHRITSIYGGAVYVPVAKDWFDLGIIYMPFTVFVIVAIVNSVNLTDGLDGLAVGNVAIVMLFFVTIAFDFSYFANVKFNSAVVGACLGFLMFNKHKAKIFMGDTGSLALGGALAATVLTMEMELIFTVAGFVFVMEALSVVLQVGSFKLRGKRIFRMAPLHHHFELMGLHERYVVNMFWGASLFMCVVAWFIVS